LKLACVAVQEGGAAIGHGDEAKADIGGVEGDEEGVFRAVAAQVGQPSAPGRAQGRRVIEANAVAWQLPHAQVVYFRSFQGETLQLGVQTLA